MYPRRNSEKNDSYYDDEDYLISRKMLGNDEAYGDDSYYDDEDYLDMADAVSSNDCTGLLTHGTGLEECRHSSPRMLPRFWWITLESAELEPWKRI